MATCKKICGGGKRYCVLCSHYEGQVTDNGSVIRLHSIPKDPPVEKKDEKSVRKRLQRKAWLSRIKLVRPDAPITGSTRVCCLHFAGGSYTGRDDEVPTVLHLDKPRQEEKHRRPLVRRTVEFKENINASQPTTMSESSVAVQTDIATKDMSCQCNLIPSPPIMKDAAVETKLPFITVEDIEGNDQKTRFYTGFKNWGTFWLIFQTLLQNHGAAYLRMWDGQKRSMDAPGAADRKYQNSNFEKPGRQRTLRPQDEFFLLWLRLRHNIAQEMLGDMFCVSVKTVSRVLNTWVNFVYDHFKGLICWPTREQILSNLPRHFSNSQMVRTVLDATEFFVEKPSSLTSQYLTWSDYKSHNTMKIVIGVAPNGLVNFVSRLWGGRASDRLIVQEDGDGFIPKLEPGDVVMADKGFTIADLLPPDNGLNMPPFVSRSKQMTSNEFFTTQQIASPRIVVEMKMEQVKNYRILQGIFPLSEAHLAEQIIVICVGATNLLDPLLL